MRMSEKQRVIAAFNFSNEVQEYDLQLEEGCEKLLVKLSSEWDVYGGTEKKKAREVIRLENGRAKLKLLPFSAVYYET